MWRFDEMNCRYPDNHKSQRKTNPLLGRHVYAGIISSSSDLVRFQQVHRIWARDGIRLPTIPRVDGVFSVARRIIIARHFPKAPLTTHNQRLSLDSRDVKGLGWSGRKMVGGQGNRTLDLLKPCNRLSPNANEMLYH